MKKNVKGIIGLFLSLAGIGCLALTIFLPMEKLTGFGIDGRASFYGNVNFIISWAGVALCIVGIVFGALSIKDKDKKGPRKAGIIFGVLGLIFGLVCSLVIGLFSAVTEFINSEGQSGIVADAIKDNPDAKKSFDDIIKAIQKSAGIEATGIGGETSESETSNADGQS